jgi:hypothetical protein
MSKLTFRTKVRRHGVYWVYDDGNFVGQVARRDNDDGSTVWLAWMAGNAEYVDATLFATRAAAARWLAGE